MFGIWCIISGIIVGMILAAICESLFGDNPMARLLKLIISVVGGIAYVFLMLAIDDYTIIVADWLGIVVFIAPVAIFVILWILRYMYK